MPNSTANAYNGCTVTILDKLNSVRFGREYLLKALDAADGHLDFRPTAPSAKLPMYSLREHFLHIADIGEMFVDIGVLDQKFDVSRYRMRPADDGTWTLREPLESVADVRAELEASWRYQDEHVFSHPVGELISMVGPDAKCLLADEISWMVFHESQHRGQIMTLLRLAGAEPPEW